MSARLRALLLGMSLVCLSAQGAAEPADTATREAARTLALAGVDSYEAGSFDAASDKLEKAYGLLNVPSIGLWSARALAKRQLLLEAADRYAEVVSMQLPQGDAAVQRQAQTDAQSELDQLRPRIPRLVVAVRGAAASDLSISIDGKPAPLSVVGKPRLVDPGQHHVEAQGPAGRQSRDVVAVEGNEASVSFDFTATSSVGPKPDSHAPGGSLRRTLGWVGVATGGAGIVLGAVMGGAVLSKRAKLEDKGCTSSHCPYEQKDEVKRLDTFRTVSGVGFIAGGVLAATGVALLLTAPSQDVRVEAAVLGSGVALKGRF